MLKIGSKILILVWLPWIFGLERKRTTPPLGINSFLLGIRFLILPHDGLLKERTSWKNGSVDPLILPLLQFNAHERLSSSYFDLSDAGGGGKKKETPAEPTVFADLDE